MKFWKLSINYESENLEKEDDDGVISSTSSSEVHPPQPASQDSGQVGILMNNKLPTSPNSLTEKLESESNTPSASKEETKHTTTCHITTLFNVTH